jgi:hypothetical protein
LGFKEFLGAGKKYRDFLKDFSVHFATLFLFSLGFWFKYEFQRIATGALKFIDSQHVLIYLCLFVFRFRFFTKG